MLVSSVFELVGIAIMSPFLNALLQPEYLMANEYVGFAAQRFGIRSYTGFLAILVVGIIVIYIVKNILLIY